MDCLAPLWSELLKQQSHSLFQRFGWNRLAAEMFSDRLTPHVVCVEGDSGAAIIPAAINHATKRLELLGELLFDYRDVLHTGSKEILRQAWQQLGGCGHAFHVISLNHSAVNDRWAEFPWTPFAMAPQVDCTAIGENSFRLAHSRLGRQMRRLQKQGVLLQSYSGGNSEVVRRLYDGKRTNFAANEDNVFLDSRRCAFMVAAAALEGDACEVYTLEDQASELVAGLVTFRERDIRRFYTIYFNPEWARYSPGLALLYEVTARSLAEGLSCDYMTGEYPYKLRFANASRPLFRVELSAEELAEIAARTPVSSAA